MDIPHLKNGRILFRIHFKLRCTVHLSITFLFSVLAAIAYDIKTKVHNYELPVTASSDAKLLQLEKSDTRGIFVNLKVYDLGM